MIVINDIEVVVRCPRGHSNKFDIRDWECDVLEREERPMGAEIHHGLSLEGVLCTHPGCGCEIDANIDIWEYPDGCENHFECSSNVDATTAREAVSITMR